MEIELETIIKLDIKGHEISLSGEEAEELFQKLKTALKKGSDVTYIPIDTTPYKPIWPYNPTWTYLNDNTRVWIRTDGDTRDRTRILET